MFFWVHSQRNNKDRTSIIEAKQYVENDGGGYSRLADLSEVTENYSQVVKFPFLYSNTNLAYIRVQNKTLSWYINNSNSSEDQLNAQDYQYYYLAL